MFSKDLPKRQSDKVLRDKALKIASDPKYDSYQRGLALIFYKFFDKTSNGSGVDVNRLLKNSGDEKFIHPLETIFGMLI